MEGEGPVLGDENKGVEGELAPRNGSAQLKLACWGVQPPRHPSDLGRVAEVGTWGLNSGSGQQEDVWRFRPSVQAPSHSSLQTD